jgi:Tol biopolymer transport system component
MKTETSGTFRKLFHFALGFTAAFSFGVTMTFGQAGIGRANGKIAFTRTHNGNADIYTINPDGTDIRQLRFEPGLDEYPAWSPDGTRIAYLSQPQSGQYVIKTTNFDGRGQTIVTPIAFDLSTRGFSGEGFSLNWSPDGGKIVFQRFSNIVTRSNIVRRKPGSGRSARRLHRGEGS